MEPDDIPAPVAGEEVTTEGQVETPPAEAEAQAAEAEEERTRSQQRRERRKAEVERLRSEADAAKAQAQAVERRLTELAQAAGKLPRPEQSQYKSFEEYQAALTAHAQMQMLDKRQIEALQEEARQRHSQAKAVEDQRIMAIAQSLNDQYAVARTKYPDFDRVALHEAPVNEREARIIAESDVAAEIAYYLGKNPEQAIRLQGMSDLEAARAIGRIEAIVSAPPSKPPTTNAPAPIAPVRPKATPAKDPEKMTPAEYDKWRRQGGSFTLS